MFVRVANNTVALYCAIAVDTAALMSRMKCTLEAKGTLCLSVLKRRKQPTSMWPVVSRAKGMKRWFIWLTAAWCLLIFSFAARDAALPIAEMSVESTG